MTFPFTTAMRLEVEDPTLDTATRNLIEGATGRLGSYGWVTRVGALYAGTYGGDETYGEAYFDYVAPSPAAASQFVSIPAAVTVSQYVSASWEATYTGGGAAPYHRARIEFLNASAAVIATSTITGYLAFTGATSFIASTVVPAGTVTARLRFDLYSNNSGANPTAGQTFRFGRIKFITKASTISQPLTVQNGPLWTNILTSATSIDVEREALGVGTLSATVPDATYDPSLNSLLRPGSRIRLMVLATTGIYGPLFTGKISTALVNYEPLRTGPKRARISLTAVDAITDLANVSRPDGVATINELRAVVEGAGVPWRINGIIDQIATATAVTRNESATALDQIAITRDSVHGYAYMSCAGVLTARDTLPTSTVTTLTESAYGDDIDISFDVDNVINVITIRLLRINAATGETVEVPYGPFRHEASIKAWGPRAAEFTVQGLTDTTTAMQAYADAVFAASAVPAIRVNSLTFRVAATTDVTSARAQLDLYDKVRITNTATGIDQRPRITGVHHSITPRDWLVDLTFAKDGGVASPQVTPAVQSLPTVPSNVWQTPSLDSPYTVVDALDPRYMKDTSGTVHLQGRALRNSAADGARLFVLPVGFRPTMRLQRLIDTAPRTTTSSGIAVIDTDGQVYLYQKTGTPTLYYLDATFTTL